MDKKLIFKIFILFLLLASYLLLLGINVVLAEEGATKANVGPEPAATTEESGIKLTYPWSGTKNLTDLVSKFYNIALAAVGVAALGAIVYGGILYTASAGSASAQAEAREWIKGAVLGLALLLGAVLLFNTIGITQEGKITEPGIAPLPEPEKTTPQFIENKTTIVGGTESHEGEGPDQKPKVSYSGFEVAVKNFAEGHNITKYNTTVEIDKSNKTLSIYYWPNGKDGEPNLITKTNIEIGVGDPNGGKKGGTNGDKITPVGSFEITNDRRYNNNNAVYDQTGKYNLGTAFVGISAKDENGNYRGIGFHGQAENKLTGTNGCIRVKNADANTIYKYLSVGTRVTINN